MKKIIPAILSHNIKDARIKIAQLEGVTKRVQVDIMDGKFVPSRSLRLGGLEIKDKFEYEVHLMVLDPEKYLLTCARLGVKKVVFHIETIINAKNFLKKAERFKFELSAAINPKTPIKYLNPFLPTIKDILFLGVEPGESGQKFLSSVLNKIKIFKKQYPKISVGVDGGVNKRNIQKINSAGPNYFVVGSALFDSGKVIDNFTALKKLLNVSQK